MFHNRMTQWGWNPWRELARVEREVNRILSNSLDDEDAGLSPTAQFPLVNVLENADNVKVVLGLPGVDPKQVDISFLGNTLTVSGETASETPAEGAVFHRKEREKVKFTRSIELPAEVNGDGTQAEYRNGLLEVTVPKAEEKKPRRIPVKVS